MSVDLEIYLSLPSNKGQRHLPASGSKDTAQADKVHCPGWLGAASMSKRTTVSVSPDSDSPLGVMLKSASPTWVKTSSGIVSTGFGSMKELDIPAICEQYFEFIDSV